MAEVTIPFADHFSTIAGRYAASRPSYPAALFQFLNSAAPKDGLTLDIGAGSGQASHDLRQFRQPVFSIDASINQLRAAPDQRRAICVTAFAERLPLRNASVSLLLVAQAVHWFQLEDFLAEAQRVLQPGGLLALVGYGATTSDDEAVATVLMEIHELMSPWWPREREILDRGYDELHFPFRRVASPPITMEVAWNRSRLEAYISTWSAVCRSASHGSDPMVQIADMLSRAWPDDAVRTVRWPFYLVAGNR